MDLPRYRSYLLRIWRHNGTDPRVELEELQSGTAYQIQAGQARRIAEFLEAATEIDGPGPPSSRAEDGRTLGKAGGRE